MGIALWVPDAVIVAIFLGVAGVSIFFTPMVFWMRAIQGIALIYLASLYAVTNADVLTMAQRASMLRFGLIVFSSIIIITSLTWVVAKKKAGRK